MTVTSLSRFIQKMLRRSFEFLIVDDEEIMRRFLAREFEGRGFSSDTASNAPEAIEKIKIQKFALIISDLSMPGGDGDMLLNPSPAVIEMPPLILMSSVLDSRVELFLSRGALAVIEKPLRIKELADEILRKFEPINSQVSRFHV